MKKYLAPILMLIIFETVAITLWLTKDNVFYLFNFSYIGLSVSLGIFLFIRNYKHARRIVQLALDEILQVLDVGVYVGNREVIECTLGSRGDGIVKTPLSAAGWTHWLKVPEVAYADEGKTAAITKLSFLDRIRRLFKI